jgi:predicted dehydrogenase
MAREAGPLGWKYMIVGCGSIGKRHIRNLSQLGVHDIIAIDPSAERRAEVMQKLGIRAFETIDEGLSQSPDVALICTPTSFHLQDSLAVARAGCHIFIEKPVSHQLQGTGRLIDEVRRKKLLTLVGCNFRFHPGLQQVKLLLEEEAIGPVRYARASFGHYLPDWHPWEDYRQGYSALRRLGGGVLLDRVHEVDYLRWLLGEFSKVSCALGRLGELEIDTEDTAELTLWVKGGGCLVSVHLDYLRRTYDCSAELLGDEGLIKWSFADNSVRWLVAREKRWKSRRWPNYDINQMYVEEMRHFLRVLEGKEASAQDVIEALRNLEIITAARRSARLGRVVRI